jgi:SAM-dependent methyltransferase
MSPFEYVPREACICGALLDPEGRRVARRYPPGEVRFLRCGACASWCQSPRISAASLLPWIESPAYFGSRSAPGAAYSDYFADEPQRLREAEHRWQRTLRQLAPPGAAVLEIGCATGSILSVLRRQGCEVAGIDLSREFADFARRVHGLEIVRGDFLACDLGSRRFDLILLLGTWCNLPRLHESLVRVRALLSAGGALLFNFPDATHWIARAYGRRYWMFAPTVDVFPTRQGCESALRRAGLRLRSMRTDRQRPSLRKLLKHARMEPLLAVAARLGVEHIPVHLPVPGIRLACAAADARG